MSRAIMRRLERMERQCASSPGKVHMMLGKVGDDDDTFERRVTAFRASLPDYQEERDTIICVRFVSPEQVRAERAAA